jgi:hypothetical protein
MVLEFSPTLAEHCQLGSVGLHLFGCTVLWGTMGIVVADFFHTGFNLIHTFLQSGVH